MSISATRAILRERRFVWLVCNGKCTDSGAPADGDAGLRSAGGLVGQGPGPQPDAVLTTATVHLQEQQR